LGLKKGFKKCPGNFVLRFCPGFCPGFCLGFCFGKISRKNKKMKTKSDAVDECNLKNKKIKK